MSSLGRARKDELKCFDCANMLSENASIPNDNDTVHPIICKKVEEQCLWIIESMIDSPVYLDELPNLNELVKNRAWLETKSFMTAAIAQRVGKMNNFHARWSGERNRDTGVSAFLRRHALPFRQISILHPLKNDGLKLYFLMYDPALMPQETGVIVDDLLANDT